MKFTVYIVECSDGTFYTGITRDLPRRLQMHNGDLPGGARYTRSRRPVKLLYQKQVNNQREAMQTELSIKRLPRSKKIQLIRDQHE